MDHLPGVLRGFKLISGNANRGLAEEIARNLGVDLARVTATKFADGEIFVRIDENIRGADVFIVQPTSPPTNHHLMELFIMIDAMKRATRRKVF